MEEDWSFLNLNINVSSKSNITSHWYQKPTDTGIILNFYSRARLQHKKNEIQGTVHRVFNANSNWLAFDQALEKNLLDQKSVSRGMVFKNNEPDVGKDIKLRLGPNENNTKRASKNKTQDLKISQHFYYTFYSKLCKQIEETMRFASGN